MATSVAGHASFAPAADRPYRVRYNVSSARAQPHIDALRRALIIMRGLGEKADVPTHLRSIWKEIRSTNQGRDPETGRASSDVSNHELSLGRQAARHLDLFRQIHGSWNFFPWHRAQLIFFEAVVAHLSDFPEFAMPYWDFTTQETHKLPGWFSDRSSPFFVQRSPGSENADIFRRRQEAVTGDPESGSDPLPLADMLESDIELFMGGTPERGNESPCEVEWGSHNFVHRQLGGFDGEWVFGRGRSPADPVFWFHHCNIDRVWASWQEGNGTTDPSRFARAFRQASFIGHFWAPSGTDPILNPEKVTLAELLSVNKLRYGYDKPLRSAQFQIPFSPEGWTLDETRTLSGEVRGKPRESKNGGVSQTIAIDQAALPSKTKSMWSQITSAILRISVLGPMNQYGLRIFLHAPQTDRTALNAGGPAFVNFVIPFGMKHVEHHQAGCKIALRVTKQLSAALVGAKRPVVGVTIVPIELSSGRARESGLVFEGASITAETALYRR